MSSALTLRAVSAGYGALRVLDRIDLSVEPGERLGIVGLNGHGKSTLLRAIAGLADWRDGEIAVWGRPIDGLPAHRLAREGVTLIPQGDAIFPGLSVRENLDSGAYSRTAWRDRVRRREAVLEIFPRLADRLDQAAGTLSGGERRMVSIGRGLMGSADVYLIDEPSLGLAPGVAAAIVETLAGLGLDGGALLLAEQNRPLIDGRVDRIVRMHAGRLSANGDAPAPANGAATGSGS